MRGLDRLGLIDPLRDAIAEGKPFLGLCLGLQLLFDKSEEAPLAGGLGILKGRVKRFARGPLKVPHMGWNNIIFGRRQNADLKILNGVSDNSYMYFLHSYYAKRKDESVILTETDYGIRFVSGIRKNNIFGFQFHPEKSQRVGLRVLRNFVNF